MANNYGLLENGFVSKRQSDIKNELERSFADAFADDKNIDALNLSPETPEGQVIGIISEQLALLWETAHHTYNSFDPAKATGVAQDNLYQLNRLKRRVTNEARLFFEGIVGEIVPAGTEVLSEEGFVYVTIQDYEIVEIIDRSSSLGVIAFCDSPTPIDSPIGTINELLSPASLPFVSSVSNKYEGSFGKIESDEDFRARQVLSTAIPSQNMTESLHAQLLDFSEILMASVYENDTNDVGSNTLPPRTYAAVVLGGYTNDIARTVWINKPPGIPNYGLDTAVIKDSQGLDVTVNFTRAIEQPIEVYITTQKLVDYPNDGDSQIVEALKEWSRDTSLSGAVKIGRTVQAYSMYEPISKVKGQIINDIRIKRPSDSNLSQSVFMAWNEVPLILGFNVYVNGVRAEDL